MFSALIFYDFQTYYVGCGGGGRGVGVRGWYKKNVKKINGLVNP